MYTQAMDTQRDEGGDKPALCTAEEAQLQQRFDSRIDAGDFISRAIGRNNHSKVARARLSARQ